MNPFTAAETALHLTDLLLIGSNFLIILATVALSYYTAKVAQETAREVKREDSRILRMLVRNGRVKNAKHAKGQEKGADVRRLG